MKKILLILIYIIPIYNYGWGDKGHKLITKQALINLQNEIKFSEDFKSSIIEHSIDPDYRKKHDSSEPPKHFIDIDYYKEFLNGQMIFSIDSLKKIYGDSVVTVQGILPWATISTYFNLIDAFKKNDKEKILLYTSDLAHYIGDGHQPLHTTLNYNGQLTSQKGIHFRYEIEMIDNHLEDIEKNMTVTPPIFIQNISEFIFDYITESNFEVDILLSADKFATQYGNGKFETEYYRILWFRTKHLTIEKFEQASFALASLIYTAWVNANKPEIIF